MKKIWILVLTFILIVTASSCGIRKEESVSVKDADLYSEYKIDTAEIKEKDDFSKDGFSLSVSDISYEDVVTKINLKVKNNKDKEITVATTDLSVNGLMCNDSVILTMRPMSKNDTCIEISNEWFSDMNITTITDIEFVVKIFDEKNEEILKSDVIKVKTDAPWTYRQKYDKDGFLVYKGNGISLFAREVKKSELSGDYELVFFAENKSKSTISIMSEEVLVNGKAIEPLFVMTVGEDKKCIDSMLFYEKDLNDAEIKEIKTVKAKFKAFDESLKTVFETEIIEIPVK